MTHAVTVDGVEVGRVITDVEGEAQLELADGKGASFPAGFPEPRVDSVVKIGTLAELRLGRLEKLTQLEAIVAGGRLSGKVGFTVERLGSAVTREFKLKRKVEGKDVEQEVDMLDLPYDFDSLIAAGSMSGSGAIIVLDDSTDIVEALANIAEFYAHESCGQCTPCREGSLWMAKALHRLTHGEGRKIDADYLALACPVCGATSLHPVSGGSQPFEIQKLFLRTYARRADELGIPAEERTFPALLERVRQRIVALDGEARSAIDHMQTEDDGPARAILAEWVRRADGFRCVSDHNSAEQALAHLPAKKPGIVLTDINLPGMSDGSITIIDLVKGEAIGSIDSLKDQGFNPNSIVLLPQWNHLGGH